MTPSNQKKPDSNASSSVGLGILFRGIGRYPLITFGFVLLAGVAGAAIWFYLPLPKMTGYAVIQIKEQADYVLNPVNMGDAKIAFNAYRLSQAALIKSRRVLTEALKDSNLKNVNKRGWQPDEETWLENQLKVDFKLGNEFMKVTMEGDDPETLTKVLGAVVEAYKEQVKLSEFGKKQERLTKLEELQKKTYKRIQDVRDRLKAQAEKAPLGTSEPNAIAAREKYIQEGIGQAKHEVDLLERELLQLQTSLKTQRNMVQSLQEVKITKEEIDAKLKADLGLQKLLEERKALQDRINVDKSNLKKGITHPQIENREKELALLDERIGKYKDSIKALIIDQIKIDLLAKEKAREIELDRLLKAKDEMKKEFEKRWTTRMEEAKELKKNQLQLEEDVAQLGYFTKMYDNLFSQIEILKPEIQDKASRIDVWEPATAIPGIEGNRRVKYSGMALGFVLLCGVGLVSWLEYRNRRILHVTEVTGELGLRFVGSVPALPKQALKSRSPILDDKLVTWQHHLTETIDNTRTMLLHGMDTSSPVRTIMISSALSGEGKTSLSGHLAVSLARGGYKTLVIDADMRRPSLHKVFNVEMAPGLSEVLRFKAELRSVIRETQIPGLSMISAGDWSGALPSVLAGDRFADIKTELEQEFDYIIVDSPPLLPVADSLMIARHVDGVLISLLRDVSQLEAVSEAKDRLTNVGTKILGVVMNGMKHELFQYSSYYYRHRPQENSLATKV